MKNTYPVVLTKDKTGYTVFIPDFKINTQGKNLNEALYMAQDAIIMMGSDMLRDGKALPTPSKNSVISLNPTDILKTVEVDFPE